MDVDVMEENVEAGQHALKSLVITVVNVHFSQGPRMVTTPPHWDDMACMTSSGPCYRYQFPDYATSCMVVFHTSGELDAEALDRFLLSAFTSLHPAGAFHLDSCATGS